MVRLALAIFTLALMTPAAATLAQSTPASQAAARYACPMKCEGDKTYSAPGKCPVCHMDLKQVGAYTMTLTGSPAKSNEPSDLSVKITDSAGAPAKALGKVDLYIVLRDLSSFAHVQPPAGTDGAYAFKQTLAPGDYVVLAAFRPDGGAEQFARASLSVSGKAANPKAMGVDADRPKTIEGVSVACEGSKDIKSGQDATVTFKVTRDGAPVALEPMNGPSVRLVGVSPDLKHLVRAQSNDTTVKVKFPEPGLYRIWIEFQRAGKVTAVPFVVEAK